MIINIFKNNTYFPSDCSSFASLLTCGNQKLQIKSLTSRGVYFGLEIKAPR